MCCDNTQCWADSIGAKDTKTRSRSHRVITVACRRWYSKRSHKGKGEDRHVIGRAGDILVMGTGTDKSNDKRWKPKELEIDLRLQEYQETKKV